MQEIYNIAIKDVSRFKLAIFWDIPKLNFNSIPTRKNLEVLIFGKLDTVFHFSIKAKDLLVNVVKDVFIRVFRSNRFKYSLWCKSNVIEDVTHLLKNEKILDF